MQYCETRFVDMNSENLSINAQMETAVLDICHRLMSFPEVRGYSRNMESFKISCSYDVESNMLRVTGEISHTQRGYTKKELVDGMAEAFMDWDKERGRKNG